MPNSRLSDSPSDEEIAQWLLDHAKRNRDRRFTHPGSVKRIERRGGDKPKRQRPGRMEPIHYAPYDRELPDHEFCCMCGQEYGTALHPDGRYYCSRCWQVWNS